jgi:hypothetical protein
MKSRKHEKWLLVPPILSPGEHVPYQEGSITGIHSHPDDRRDDTPSNATPGHAHIPKQRPLDISMANTDVGLFRTEVQVNLP